MTDWLDLESKFRAINDPYGELRADWTQVSGGPEHWRVGSVDRFARGRFEALASLAGNALSGCPNFPVDLLQDTDPVHRWLNAVRHKTHYFKIGSGSLMVSPYVEVRDGDETYTLLLGTIDRVCEASAILCLQLAAEAQNVQPTPDKVKVDEQVLEVREQSNRFDELRRKYGAPQESRRQRLNQFCADRKCKQADIWRSAGVHRPDGTRWKKGKLPAKSVMSNRIERVLSGEHPLERDL